MKRIIEESIVYGGREFPLFKLKCIQKNQMLVLNTPSNWKHYHFFIRDGMPVCQLTIEGKIKKHFQVDKTLVDIRREAITNNKPWNDFLENEKEYKFG